MRTQTLPAFLSNERCRAIRARFAEQERQELIAKNRADLAAADAALREPRMAWLAERIRESGGARTYQLLVNQGNRRGDAEEAVNACGVLLGNKLFALSNLKKLGAKP